MSEPTTRRFHRMLRQAFPPRVDTGMEAYKSTGLQDVIAGVLWVLAILAILWLGVKQ